MNRSSLGAAEHFAPIIEKPEALLVPTITLFEVFKRIAVQRDENDAIVLRTGVRYWSRARI